MMDFELIWWAIGGWLVGYVGVILAYAVICRWLAGMAEQEDSDP